MMRVVLMLLLNISDQNSESTSEDVVACDSYDWNGTNYTEGGSYTYEYTNDEVVLMLLL